MSFDPTRVRALCFDLDGTLADTDDDYLRRAQRLIGPLGALFPNRDPKPFLRWGLTTAISPLNTLMGFPDILGIDDELVKLSNWFADRLGKDARGHWVLMAGVEAVLARLGQRYPLALVTARSERSTRSFVEQFGLGSYFHLIAHAQAAKHAKPYPDPIRLCAEQWGLPPSAFLMIGDTAVDVRCGRRAGAQTIGVLCGFGSRRELEAAGADLVIDHTTRLMDVLGDGLR